MFAVCCLCWLSACKSWATFLWDFKPFTPNTPLRISATGIWQSSSCTSVYFAAISAWRQNNWGRVVHFNSSIFLSMRTIWFFESNARIFMLLSCFAHKPMQACIPVSIHYMETWPIPKGYKSCWPSRVKLVYSILMLPHYFSVLPMHPQLSFYSCTSILLATSANSNQACTLYTRTHNTSATVVVDEYGPYTSSHQEQFQLLNTTNAATQSVLLIAT